jgi:hypothetical protein
MNLDDLSILMTFLAVVLALNLGLAEKQKNGEAIVGPWAPDNPPQL